MKFAFPLILIVLLLASFVFEFPGWLVLTLSIALVAHAFYGLGRTTGEHPLPRRRRP